MFGRILFKMAFENTPKKPARKYIRIYPCDSDDITCRCERMQEPCRLHSRIRYILIGTYPNLLGHHECMRPRPRPPPPLRWPPPSIRSAALVYEADAGLWRWAPPEKKTLWNRGWPRRSPPNIRSVRSSCSSKLICLFVKTRPQTWGRSLALFAWGRS